jgi:uncharacterized repeat protein (TIGR01451 family)
MPDAQSLPSEVLAHLYESQDCPPDNLLPSTAEWERYGKSSLLSESYTMFHLGCSWLLGCWIGLLAPASEKNPEPSVPPGKLSLAKRAKSEEGLLLPPPMERSGNPTQGDCENCPKPVPPPPPPELPTPVVTLQMLAPADSGDRKEIEYRICIENHSEAPAYHVMVKNMLPKNATYVRSEPAAQIVGKELRWDFGTLEPGERRVILLVLAPTGPGKVLNCARVAFEHGVCVETCTSAKPATSDKPDTPLEPPPPTPPSPLELKNGRISLNIKAPDRQTIANAVVYQITVTNEGNVPVSQLLLTARYPAQATFVSASGNAQRPPEGRQVSWNLGTLDVGKSLTVELQLRPTQAGRLQLQAEATGVTSSGQVRAARQAETEIFGSGAMHLEVTDSLDPVLVGEETDYVILVRNQGDGPLTNIRLTATAPPEIGVIRVQGAVNHRKEGQMVVYDPFDLLPKNETVFRITTQAVKSGFVRFTVTLTADQLPQGIVREEEGTNILSDPETEQAFRPWHRREAAKPKPVGK